MSCIVLLPRILLVVARRALVGAGWRCSVRAVNVAAAHRAGGLGLQPPVCQVSTYARPMPIVRSVLCCAMWCGVQTVGGPYPSGTARGLTYKHACHINTVPGRKDAHSLLKPSRQNTYWPEKHRLSSVPVPHHQQPGLLPASGTKDTAQSYTPTHDAMQGSQKTWPQRSTSGCLGCVAPGVLMALAVLGPAPALVLVDGPAIKGVVSDEPLASPAALPSCIGIWHTHGTHVFTSYSSIIHVMNDVALYHMPCQAVATTQCTTRLNAILRYVRRPMNAELFNIYTGLPTYAYRNAHSSGYHSNNGQSSPVFVYVTKVSTLKPTATTHLLWHKVFKTDGAR